MSFRSRIWLWFSLYSWSSYLSSPFHGALPWRWWWFASLDPTSTWVLFRLLFMYRVCFGSVCKPVRPLVLRVYPCSSLSIPRCLISSFQFWSQSLACCLWWMGSFELLRGSRMLVWSCCCLHPLLFRSFALASLVAFASNKCSVSVWCGLGLWRGCVFGWRMLGSPSQVVFGRAYHKE